MYTKSEQLFILQAIRYKFLLKEINESEMYQLIKELKEVCIKH